MAERFRIPPPPRLPAVAAFALALGLPLLTFVLESALRPVFENLPFIVFVLAVALAAWTGGLTLGLASAALSGGLAYAFLTTSRDPDLVASAKVAMLVFLPVAGVIAAISAAARAGFLERESAAASLRDSEAKLFEALRARDAFLSMASHELKTPLTSLQLHVQSLLRARDGVAGPAARSAVAIQRQAARLTTLVNALLDVSRLNEARLQLDLEPVELAALVREVAARFEADAEGAPSSIRVDAPGTVCGHWDRLRVEQVVTNLLSNALKYGEGKPVTVQVGADAANARLVVADQGIGIPPHEHRRIFERFERGHATRGYGGFGLGLWITRELVTALGGRIEVESAAGAGATFRVELPMAGPPPART
jgi:signal transduction histidine kinase